MSGQTHTQVLLATHQPYTRLVSGNGGQTFSVFGYTWELEDGKEQWKEHDLGSDFSIDAAREVAAEWREQFVGVYPID